MEELSTRIGLRSDTLENWTAANPILLDGEVAVVFDGENQIFKVGNGISRFNQLPFSFYEHFASRLINTDMLKAKSISQGYATGISGIGGIATGYKSEVSANFAQAHGYQAKVSSDFGFVWNGDNTTGTTYSDHGTGSFSINPKGGPEKMYIGKRTLPEVISSCIPEYAKVSVDNQAVQDFKLLHIHYDDYAKLVADEQVDPHTMYVLSADGYDDQFGDRIANLGEPKVRSDAATKGYVDDEIAKIPAPDLSEYYKKTETSSSIELVNEFSKKASQEQVDGIEAKIPNAATSENQLADKAFVNSSINNYAAFYLTKNANGDAFGTYAELTSAIKFWNAGVEKTPSKNDYLVVLQDETKTTALSVDPTTRYTYQGEWPTGQFEFQYIVNNTALTQAQVDAINSGITKSIVDSRVIPSTSNPGYAANADIANTAFVADTANHAYTADDANNAKFSLQANEALSANTALTANTATYAPDYTPLSTFNQTLGDLTAIIHGI